MTVTARPKRMYAKTVNRQREILEACIEVFAASGFRNGTLREIGARVGLTDAGVLHHFANKVELLSAVLALRDERAAAFVPGGEDELGLETVRGFVRLVEHNAETRGLVELHATLSAEAASGDHPAHDYFSERYEWVVSLLEEAFQRMATAGQLREGVDPESASRATVALADGLEVQWLFHPSKVDMAAEIRKYLTLVTTEEI